MWLPSDNVRCQAETEESPQGANVDSRESSNSGSRLAVRKRRKKFSLPAVTFFRNREVTAPFPGGKDRALNQLDCQCIGNRVEGRGMSDLEKGRLAIEGQNPVWCRARGERNDEEKHGGQNGWPLPRRGRGGSFGFR